MIKFDKDYAAGVIWIAAVIGFILFKIFIGNIV